MHWLQFEIVAMGIMTTGVLVAVAMLIWDAVRDFKRARRLDRDKRD